MTVSSAHETPYAAEIKVLYTTALAVFVVTVGIGLVNGQQILTLSRAVVLTHLHTGTLGWITLMLFAAVIWLFTAGQPATAAGGASVRRLARFTAVAVGCYPVTFSLFFPGGPLGNPAALGLFGTLALVGILWQLVWTIRRSRTLYLGIARLAALGALVNLTIGAVLGVLIEAQFAGLGLPVGNVFAAHPGMMTAGYIVPAALAIVEWQLLGGADGRRDWPGVVAVGLLVVAGWAAAIGLGTGLVELLMVMALGQIVAVVLFAIRAASRVARTPWLNPNDARHVAMATVAVVVDVALLVALTATVVTAATPDAPPPQGLLIALAHTEFVGMMTNAFFATLSLATAGRRAAVWPWADHVLFWGLNIGWVGFVAAELAGATGLIRVFTPLLGVSILIGIAAHALRLRAAATPATASMPAPGGD